jgi:hypothetical protein
MNPKNNNLNNKLDDKKNSFDEQSFITIGDMTDEPQE